MPDDADAAETADATDDDVEPWGPGAGRRLISFSWATTAAFAAAATIATAFPDQAARPVAVFEVGLFVVGIGAFVVAYARGVSRSRTDRVEIASLYFLAGGTAPKAVRRQLLGAFALQIVIALVSSSIRLYTSVAFGILVPMLGLGLAGVWGATHGRFPKRDP
jgi:hypothetical protein